MACAIFRLILLIYGNHVKDLSSSVTAHEHVLFSFCLSIDLPQSLLKVFYLQALHMHTFLCEIMVIPLPILLCYMELTFQ